jgi:hypothetical protein
MSSQNPRRETAGGYLLFNLQRQSKRCWHDSKAHRGVPSAIISGQGVNCGACAATEVAGTLQKVVEVFSPAAPALLN